MSMFSKVPPASFPIPTRYAVAWCLFSAVEVEFHSIELDNSTTDRVFNYDVCIFV